jgi:hypothetical protein
VNVVRRRLTTLLLISGILIVRGSTAAVSDIPRDPFAWLQPVVHIDSAARGRIARGEVIVQILPAGDGELGVFAASRLDADPEMLAVWADSIADLKKSPYVLAVRRFSDPPVLDDLDGLMLDDGDIDSVRDCRQGSCGLKMAAGEIESLRHAAGEGGLLWKDAVKGQFRQIVIDRVNAYRSKGFAGLSPYVDRHNPVYPQSAFGVLLDNSPYLRSDPIADVAARTESFFYWSKEQYGTGKRVITVTHVDVVRPLVPCAVRVALVSTEILATHYRNASLGLTAVVEDVAGQAYLVYVNRSQLDVLGGFFGALKRAIVEGRLKNESVMVLGELRRRLESGPPGGDATAASPQGSTPDRLTER